MHTSLKNFGGVFLLLAFKTENDKYLNNITGNVYILLITYTQAYICLMCLKESLHVAEDVYRTDAKPNAVPTVSKQ